MIRGTATQFKLILPYTNDQINEINIMFWQPGNPNTLNIIKHKEHCSCSATSPNEFYVSLSPSDTARFSDKYKAKMQFNVVPLIGQPVGSKEHLITVYPMPDNIIPGDDDYIPAPPIEDEWAYLDGGHIDEED